MSRCTCDRYRIVLPNGETTEGERVRDPDCREHGFPTSKWPSGHPLYRHAKIVVRATGELIDRDQASHRYRERDVSHWWSWDQLFREETPRETEERLYRESLAGPSPKRRAPLKKRGSRCDA